MDITSNKICVNEKQKLPYDGDSNTSIYYGVHIPSDIQVQDNDGCINVFHDKTEALKVVKKYKKARFKAFNYYHEALDFAVHGAEYPNNNTAIDGLYGKQNGESAQAVGEKPCQFRGPKSQDLVKLRKGIEAGDIAFVNNCIWENPRYLISSGDTPSILQEGFRYNGLHVAAKAKNAQMCELILSTISNINFIKLLYGDDNHQNAEDRSRILVDLYLNTPDKGLNETPLHFAVKFGAVECVEVLTSYPQCDRNFENKHGKIPSMIICDRCDASVPIATKKKIATLLKDSYYVPVLRTEDNSMPPVIGEPFSPKSPPTLNSNPISPRLEIHAYAGPMDKEGAEKFRKIWKCTPRSLKFSSPARVSTNDNQKLDSIASRTFRDPEKGLERLGKNLASKFAVAWKEYWPFLDSFIDISSDEGLDLLEGYLRCLNTLYSPPCELFGGDEGMSSDCGKEGGSLSKTDLSSMSELCKAFQAWNLNDTTKSDLNWCGRENDVEDPRKSELGPFLCLEKSCQVFAHRISNDILHLLEFDNWNYTLVVLEDQMKHLEVLMASFMNDGRFSEVDFRVVHSRLGALVAGQIKDALTQNDELNYVCKNVELWLEKCGKNLDCFSSDDESNGQGRAVVRKKCTSNNRQVGCLLECVLSGLWNGEVTETDVNTEEECSGTWRGAKACGCVWQTRSGRKGMSRSGSCRERNSQRKSWSKEWLSSTRLSFDGCPVEKETTSNGVQTVDDTTEDDSSSDDEYFTPPTSPTMLECSDDEQFDESEMPETEVFIGGNCPTKTDCAVFNALRYSECKLNATRYPNIYKWYHNVGLYSEKQRESWTSPTLANYKPESPTVTSTPNRSDRPTISSMFTPPRSWLRVTQENSPRAVFGTPSTPSRSATNL